MSANRVMTETEADIVSSICEALSLMGYIPLRVNQYRADQSGSDVISDLVITSEKWRFGEAFLLEVKKPGGRLGKRRPSYRNRTFGYSQQDLYDMKRIDVVFSVDEAIQAVRFYEQRRLSK